MGYSITTEDGITLDNIPDHIKPDAPELKQRVQQVRAVHDATQAGGDASKGGKTSSAAMGFLFDLPAAAGQGVAALGELPTAVKMALPGLGVIGEAPKMIRAGIRGALNMVGANETASLFEPAGSKEVNSAVSQVNREHELDTKAAGREGFDWSRLGGAVANPLNWVAPVRAGAAAQTIAPAVVRSAGQTAPLFANGVRGAIYNGAAAGATGGALTPVDVPEGGSYAAEKGKQVGLSALGGALLGPAATKVAEVGAKAYGAVARRFAPPAEFDPVQVTNLLTSQGMNVDDVPLVIKESVARQLKEALAGKRKPEADQIVRLAQAEAVGLTGDAGLTVGQSTRAPIQLAQERNFSGVTLDGPQGPYNPMADRINNQNLALQRVFDNAGASQAVDRTTGGDQLIKALREADVPVRSGVNDLYTTARSMNGGRAAELDRSAFSQSANKVLDEQMLGHYLPAEARSMLNDVSSGKTPFTVETAVQMDSLLSAAQRSAPNDAVRKAIGAVRTELNNAPMAPPPVQMPGPPPVAPFNPANVVDNGITDVASTPVYPPGLPRPAGAGLAPEPTFPPPPQPAQPGTGLGAATPPPVNEGEAARAAFEQARTAARSRFATIEQTPALKAALDNEAPDAFVRKFVINADVRDTEAMKKVLSSSPEALAQARAQLAEHLRTAAYGARGGSGDKSFASERYLKTLDAIGKQKLEVFFTPQEVVQLKLAGKVADDINSIPAGARYATNTSGSGAAVMNLLSKLTEAVPGGKYVVGAARFLGNQSGQAKMAKEINRALSGQLPPEQAIQPELSPAAAAAIQRLFAPAGAAAGIGIGFGSQ